MEQTEQNLKADREIQRPFREIKWENSWSGSVLWISITSDFRDCYYYTEAFQSTSFLFLCLCRLKSSEEGDKRRTTLRKPEFFEIKKIPWFFWLVQRGDIPFSVLKGEFTPLWGALVLLLISEKKFCMEKWREFPSALLKKIINFKKLIRKTPPCSGSKSMATLTLVMKFSIKIYLIIFITIIKQNQNLIANIL
jgi:hypothetical protein